MTDSSTEKAESKLETVLAYAARGWRVIPVHGIRDDGECTCRQPLCEHPGKHPYMSGSFEKYATTDATIITGWYSRWPEANVGVVCGKNSGLWVLDVDGAHGFAELDEFETRRRDGPLAVLRVRTGSGGLHLYLRWDESQRIKTKIAARFGVDVKANGFVVAPPSRHASGSEYEWLDSDWKTRSLKVAPDDLVHWVKESPRVQEEQAGDGQEWPSVAEMLRDGLGAGQRDDGIFHAAWTLLKAGVARRDVEVICDRIAGRCVPPFPYDQARAKVDSAWKRLETERGAVDDVLSSWASGVVVSGQAESGELWGGFGGTTDLANARRLRSTWANGRPLKGGGWLVWNGILWERQEGRPLDAMATHLSDVISREVELTGWDKQEALLRHRAGSENAGRVNAAAQIAETMTDWLVRAEDLDANLWVALTVSGELVDLRTGEVRRGTREDMCTRSWSCEWEGPNADCPTFKQTLEWALRDEERGYARQVSDALQLFLGVALTGLPLKSFAVLHGPGNTGKSTLLDGFARALGGYAGPLPRDLVTITKNRQHPTGLTELEGRRFVYCAEPDVGEELNVQLIKDITGGENMQAHKMHKDFYLFPLRAKLVIDTNHPLRFGEVSRALEERYVPLGLRSEIPAEERRGLDDVRRALDSEAPGIVAWAWRGLKRYVDAGCPGDLGRLLGMALLQERGEDVAEQDIVGRWVEERLREVGDVETPGPTAQEVRDDFVNWCGVHGVTYNVEKFAREVKARLRAGVGISRRYERVKLRREGVSYVERWWGIVLK